MNKPTIARLTAEINALKTVGASHESITQARYALLNAIKHVVHRRLENRRLRAGQKLVRAGRLCLTCKANIDSRGHRAKYCEPCADKRREDMEREYRKQYDAKRRGKS